MYWILAGRGIGLGLTITPGKGECVQMLTMGYVEWYMKGDQKSIQRDFQCRVKMQLRLLWWQCSSSTSGFPSESPGRRNMVPYKAKAGFTPTHFPPLDRKGGIVTSVAVLKLKVEEEILKRHEDEAAGSCSLFLHLPESSFCKVRSPRHNRPWGKIDVYHWLKIYCGTVLIRIHRIIGPCKFFRKLYAEILPENKIIFFVKIDDFAAF